MYSSLRPLLLACISAVLIPLGAQAEERVDFNRDVRPILSAKCFHCHGADAESRKADLRLDLKAEALRERDGVRAIVPGDLTASELILRITSHDRDEVMPPPKEAESLSERDRNLLTRWVSEGAEYREHWAWTLPKLPAVPAISPHPVDAFIRDRLAREGMTPSPEAARHTLIRRVSLDLTGLPPTPAEVAAYVNDAAPGAWERVVDRLLQSPHFGERWARMWLDLARFADSTGYGSDKFRLNVWPWREWVVNAFNRNLPYDRFTIEQLAGDLLPNPAREQIVATAFHRNTMTNVEGGTVDEEYRVAAVKDRVSTTAQTWMGLTAGCAQCHTHKFDPISHHEFYSLYAVFNQTEDSDREDEEPKLALPTAEESAKSERLGAELKALESRYAVPSPEEETEQHAWEAGLVQPGDGPALPPDLAGALAIEPTERTAAQQDLLRGRFRKISEAGKALRKAIADKKKEQGEIKPVALPIQRELAADKRRKTHVFSKGNYLAPGDEVQAGLPAAFANGYAPPGAVDRLALAQWLVGAQNPLTARVTANRFWGQLFGTGLVETEEDFGTQGALPSHPELLDWLAVTFRSPTAESGLAWDTKALLRLLVTSETYRQSSRTTEEHLAKDARNRLLSHASRRRLEAEGVRDQALALSGLLTPTLGGPSVYPPQPDGLWKVAFNGGQNNYPTSTGADRYRRGLYTFWRRSQPYPSMTTFDAPSRESCSVRRIPTNTPLQAFVTLNDPCFVECAQALARRVVKEGGADDAARIRWALELVLAGPANDAQQAAIAKLLATELAHYQADGAAAKLLASGETQPLPPGADAASLAAWTVVANVLLNLDAVLMKG